MALATVKDQFNGLTPEQVSCLLERIASSLNLASEICGNESVKHGRSETALAFEAMSLMLSSIGALADLPLGGDVAGDFASWMCGPNFNEAKVKGGAA